MHLRRTIQKENAEMTDAPPWYPQFQRGERMHTVPAMKPNMTPILVTGDPNRNKVQTMPGGGYATIKIELSAKWNELVAKLGYPPIEEFFLK